MSAPPLLRSNLVLRLRASAAAKRCPRLLVRLSAGAGLGGRQSAAARHPATPPGHPHPANQSTVAWSYRLAPEPEVDVNGAQARGPEEGSGKGWGCATPTQRNGGAAGPPLMAPERKTAKEEKGGCVGGGGGDHIYLSKNVNPRKHVCWSLETRKPETRLLRPRPTAHTGAHVFLYEEILGDQSHKDQSKPGKWGGKGRKLAIHGKMQMADRPQGQTFRLDSEKR